MKYEFGSLDAVFDVDITLSYPDFTEVHYHSNEKVTARYKQEESLYLFRLDGCEQPLLNGKAPTEIMDTLMVELGHAIYPVTLSVNAGGEILDVRNFQDITKHWKEKADELLEKYPTHHFRRYLEISSRNLKDEETFLQTLQKNTFVHLFFIPFNATDLMVNFNDFPEKNGITSFFCEKKTAKSELHEYVAKLVYPSGSNGEGNIVCCYSPLGDLLELDAVFEMADAEYNRSVKKIKIKTNEKERSVSSKRKSWSTLFD